MKRKNKNIVKILTDILSKAFITTCRFVTSNDELRDANLQ